MSSQSQKVVVITGASRGIGAGLVAAYRKLGYAALYVSDGVSTQAIYSEWLAALVPHLYFGVPATIVLFSLVLMTMQRTREVMRDARQLTGTR